MRQLTVVLLASCAGCVEYGFGADVDAPGPGAAADTGLPNPGCEAASLPALAWTAAPPWSGDSLPVDAAGRTFADADFDAAGWSAAALPAVNTVPQGQEGGWRALLTLAEPLPPGVQTTLQSDDGVWLFVNGAQVGHWGGGFQEEGCVNEQASCLVTESVAPVALTGTLQPGTNVVAARISNAVAGSWFDLALTCVEGE